MDGSPDPAVCTGWLGPVHWPNGRSRRCHASRAAADLAAIDTYILDAPIQRYLPSFRLADPDASARITVHHLLQQTSGIATADGNSDITRDDRADDALEQRTRAMESLRLSQPVGATFQYANANYDLLGLLIQTVSGQPYEEYIQLHIFAPLDMRHAYTASASAQSDGLAKGHNYWFGVPTAMTTPFPRGSLPSGYLIASAEDISHYLIAQLNDGRYRDRTVLSAQGIAALHRPAVAAFEDNHYAMGYEEAKLSPGAVYHYFPSKDAIIQASFEFDYQRSLALFESATASDDPLNALTELIGFFFRGLEDAAEIGAGRVNVQGWGEALVNPPLRESLQRVMAQYLAALSQLVRRAQAIGQL